MWTLVIAAADAGDSERAANAFRQLCGAYRDAIVRYLRGRGLAANEVEDAAHDFLTTWLERENPLEGFERGERRFREFLTFCLKRFLADRHAYRTAKRRGGQVKHVPLETLEVATAQAEPASSCDLELAREVEAEALRRLAKAWATQIPGNGYERLRRVALGHSENPGYQVLAGELRVAIGTVKSWVFRLRREYYTAFRDAARPLATPDGLDAEVRYLFGLTAGQPTADGE